MELLKDKGVLELIDEIKKELRTRSIEDKVIPRFIFVCGEQILDDNGNLIDETILDTQNNIRYLIMKKFSKYKHCGEYEKESHPAQCIISEYLYSNDNAIDILTFGEILAEISECIIIVSESPGTYCELGAFALNDLFAGRTIVINEDNPKFKNSFITKGPIRKIEKKHEENVILYNGKKNLKNSLELNDMILKISSNGVKYTPNLNSQELHLKSLIYELLNLTELFEPITAYELEILYKKIREITNYTILKKDKYKIASIKGVIHLMEKMKIINSSNGYFHINKDISCYNTMFTINRKDLNAFRMRYLCRIYKCEPERIGVSS